MRHIVAYNLNRNYMKQIVSFNIARLRVEEDFGFLKLILSEIPNLPEDDGDDNDRPVIESFSAKLLRRLQLPRQALKLPSTPSTMP